MLLPFSLRVLYMWTIMETLPYLLVGHFIDQPTTGFSTEEWTCLHLVLYHKVLSLYGLSLY